MERLAPQTGGDSSGCWPGAVDLTGDPPLQLPDREGCPDIGLTRRLVEQRAHFLQGVVARSDELFEQRARRSVMRLNELPRSPSSVRLVTLIRVEKSPEAMR